MSEEDVRAGLRGLVADEPPLMFDPDELMETARRQTKRRRALAAVGVATAVVAVAAVAVPLAIGTPTGNDGVTVGGSPTTTSATAPALGPEDIKWPPPGVKPRYDTVAKLTQRGEEMQAHLSATFPSVVPGATEVEVGRFGGEATGTVYYGQDYLETTAAYLLDGTAYSISVQVAAPGADRPPEQQCFEAVSCEARKLADGSWMMNVDDDRVVHYRADGVVVRVTAYWYDTTDPTPKYAPDIPLTVDQLIELATDPELYL